MTGFGRAQGTVNSLSLTVEIQSVNRRNLEVVTSLPREWQKLDPKIQEFLRKAVSRGRVQVAVGVRSQKADQGFSVDEASIKESADAMKELCARVGASWSPDAGFLLQLISMQKSDNAIPDVETVEQEVLSLISEAVKEFVSMREEEAKSLLADLSERLVALRQLRDQVVEDSADTVPRYRELLHQRLRQAGLELELEDERVLREIAIFADRCDIAEEITRLQSHFDQFEETLRETKKPIGRKLEFILQEIHREWNTVGSKSNAIAVSQAVIEAKNEIERIREQIQNLE